MVPDQSGKQKGGFFKHELCIVQNIAGGEKLRTKIRRVFPISSNFTFGGMSDKNHSILHLVSTYIVPET